MDFDLRCTLPEDRACRFPRPSQAGARGAIDGDLGEQVVHGIRLYLALRIQCYSVRIGDDVAVRIDIVDRATAKQIDAASSSATRRAFISIPMQSYAIAKCQEEY